MSVATILPFFSAAVMGVFVVLVMRRFFVVKGGKRSYYLLIWGIGLFFYFAGGLAEALHTSLGWSALNFRVWYASGALLTAAWLGQGTVELLVRKRVAGVRVSRVLLVILAAASVFGVWRIFTADLEPAMLADEVAAVDVNNTETSTEDLLVSAASVLQATAFEDGEVEQSDLTPLAQTVISRAGVEGAAIEAPTAATQGRFPPFTAMVDGQPVTLEVSSPAYGGFNRAATGTVEVLTDGVTQGVLVVNVGHEMYGHAIVSPGVRVLTPFFNVYGTLFLVGGAIYSAYIFLRKRIMPDRVIGNVLIATGAMMPATGGLLSRFGLGGYLYVSELLGAILIFAGFIFATKKREETVKAPQVRPAEASSDR